MLKYCVGSRASTVAIELAYLCCTVEPDTQASLDQLCNSDQRSPDLQVEESQGCHARAGSLEVEDAVGLAVDTG